MNSENKIQADIVKWFNNTYCLTHHSPRSLIMSIPNGGTRNAIEAMTMKSTGLLPGASDLIFIHRGLLVWIEVKVPTGRQQPSQMQFEARVTDLGYQYKIIRSLQEFQEFIVSLNL